MRLLLALIVVAASGWSVFWWVGARGTERDLSTWIDARHNNGWVAHVDKIKTVGYPNRFDTTLTGLELVDPETGVAWVTPFLQMFRLSYEPRHIIVAWPDTHVLSTPNQKISVTSADTKGSFVFKRGPDWELERSSVVAQSLVLDSDAGWMAEVANARLASRESERLSGAVNLGLEAVGVTPANPAVRELADSGVLPRNIERVSIDASIVFDAPWDRRALETRRPNPVKLDLHLAKIVWGHLDLWAAGQVNVDRSGALSGSITLKIKNWQDLLALAQGSGWLSDGVAGALEQGLTLLAGLSGSRQTLDAPLTFTDGRVSLGPIPLGSAPKLVLR